MTNKLTDKILQEIENKHVTPKSKWSFVLKNSVFWLVFSLASIIGGLAMAVIFYIIKSFHDIPGSGWVYLPYFWILFLIIFAVIAFVNVKHTQKAYKVNPFIWVIMSVLISFAIGSLLFMTGVTDNCEEQFFNHFPGYNKMVNREFNKCTNLEKGILCGVIREVSSEYFVLQVGSGKTWQVKADVIPTEHLGHRVKLMGKVMATQEFDASRIIMLSCCEACAQGGMCERKMHE